MKSAKDFRQRQLQKEFNIQPIKRILTIHNICKGMKESFENGLRESTIYYTSKYITEGTLKSVSDYFANKGYSFDYKGGPGFCSSAYYFTYKFIVRW